MQGGGAVRSRNDSDGHGVPTLVLIKDVAPDLGIGRGALRNALRRNGYHVRQEGIHSAVTLASLEKHVARLERYAPIVARRPKGWLSRSAAAELLDIDASGVWTRITKGELKAVRYRGRLFVDPDSVQRYRLHRQMVPPSWVTLLEVGSMAKLDREATEDLPRFARARGFEVRQYKVKMDGPGTATRACIRREDVARLVELRHTKPPADYLDGDKVAALAGRHYATVLKWKAEGLPSVEDWRGFQYFDPLEVVAWLRKENKRGMKALAERLLTNLRASRERAA